MGTMQERESWERTDQQLKSDSVSRQRGGKDRQRATERQTENQGVRESEKDVKERTEGGGDRC